MGDAVHSARHLVKRRMNTAHEDVLLLLTNAFRKALMFDLLKQCEASGRAVEEKDIQRLNDREAAFVQFLEERRP
jgi:hypothetical protein